jgi:pimeloyl-ACP methyl ester carboxylesterase
MALVTATLTSVVFVCSVGAATRAASELAPLALSWHACGAPLECATLTVPLDYGEPAGPTVDLAVVRATARDAKRRIGSLVLNPGGPGASGVGYLRAVADTFPRELRDRFDLVSFDPRGVGESSPVRCPTDIDPLFDQSFSPTTAAQRAGLVDAFRVVVDACSRASGAILPHVSTRNTARDLDRLRAALGDDQLSFLGESYGSYLGTLYASLFPHRARALVLDGAIDPGGDATSVALGQARGFERALGAFLRDCAGRSTCAFQHRGRPRRAYDALRARAARKPLSTSRDGDRTVNATRFDAAVLEALYRGSAGWAGLARALSDAERGDASPLLELADSLIDRRSAGAEHPALDAFWAITCLDGPVVGDLAAAEQLEARARQIAPRLGPFVVNLSLSCSVWPVPPVAAVDPIAADGAPPILVIGTTDDPATPLVSARHLARALDRGVLLVARGVQHGGFGVGNACVDRIVTRYLVELTAPRAGRRC